MNRIEDDLIKDRYEEIREAQQYEKDHPDMWDWLYDYYRDFDRDLDLFSSNRRSEFGFEPEWDEERVMDQRQEDDYEFGSSMYDYVENW